MLLGGHIGCAAITLPIFFVVVFAVIKLERQLSAALPCRGVYGARKFVGISASGQSGDCRPVVVATQ